MIYIYTDPNFKQSVDTITAIFEAISKKIENQLALQDIKNTFIQATKYELLFWDCAYTNACSI